VRREETKNKNQKQNKHNKKEFVSGVARTIHKGNEIIVRTADLRSMDALDPVERLPRQERILRAAAMQEVVEQKSLKPLRKPQLQQLPQPGLRELLQQPELLEQLELPLPVHEQWHRRGQHRWHRV
jgi:hypothetical protein